LQTGHLGSADDAFEDVRVVIMSNHSLPFYPDILKMLDNAFDCIADLDSRIHAPRASEISAPAAKSVFFFSRILIGNSRAPTRIRVPKLEACSLGISSMISEADSCTNRCFMRVLPLASTNAVDVTLSSKLSITLILKSRGSCYICQATVSMVGLVRLVTEKMVVEVIFQVVIPSF
jgi:hypothetical protein